MAVKPASVTPIRDYWPSFLRRTLYAIGIMELVVTALVGAVLVATHNASPSNVTFWLTLFAIYIASLGLNVLLIIFLLEPFKNLMSAITQVAGEPTTTTPPNPNAKRFARNGFRETLQTIYELSTHSSQEPSEQSLKEISLIETALNNSPIGFVVLDAGHHVSYHNAHAPVTTSKDGAPVLQLEFPDNDNIGDWLARCEEQKVHAEKTWFRISTGLPGDEERRVFDIVASYEKGSAAETVLSFIDRSEQYIPEEEDLDFIAFAAHELRGPITVIRGYLDVLADELGAGLAPDQKELFKRLTVSANRLSSYVNNILNASRYDRRHLSIHLSEQSLAGIYDLINDDMQLRASSQNRILNVHIPPSLPMVAADAASISEVLGNLIDNAIKYSNEGGVVNVSAVQQGDYIEVSVQDYGIGMPSQVVSSLFHKFYRSHRSRETVAGTGIGLYISKAFIESHGGTMSVRSTEGEGSTFSFTLPTYVSVAQKLQSSNNSNENLIEHGNGWISNHAMYRG